MNRALHRVNFGSDLSGLMLELVDGVTCVVPEEVICPTSGFAFRIDVGSAKEERLDHKVLKGEFSFLDSIVYPLMAGVESTRMAAHRGETGFLCDFQDHF